MNQSFFFEFYKNDKKRCERCFLKHFYAQLIFIRAVDFRL
ncbi:hypothetical protein HMPREF1606_03261 [Escherichia coli 908522]|nr:hypothetical protein HMPREF1606_03261 [Escherichia coli 908522]